MAIEEKIILMPHMAQAPVRDGHGRTISVVETDTGLTRVYLAMMENGKQIAGQQIAFVHPNGFMHFIIPDPPQEFVDKVKAEVERQIGNEPSPVSSPPIVEDEE